MTIVGKQRDAEAEAVAETDTPKHKPQTEAIARARMQFKATWEGGRGPYRLHGIFKTPRKCLCV